MSLLWLRRRARLMAVLLLFATAFGVPHRAEDDAACGGPAEWGEQHDASGHGIRAGAAEEQAHCAVCHFARSLRSPLTALSAAADRVAPPSLINPSRLRTHPAPPLETLPARAPPALLS